MGQRRLGRVALLWGIGVRAAYVLAMKSLTEGKARLLGLRHHVDPAVVHLVQAVERIQAILALIRQAPRRLASVPGEPLRAEHDAAVEQVAVDALHYARALSDKQGENRPQRSQRPGGKVGGCQLG